MIGMFESIGWTVKVRVGVFAWRVKKVAAEPVRSDGSNKYFLPQDPL